MTDYSLTDPKPFDQDEYARELYEWALFYTEELGITVIPVILTLNDEGKKVPDFHVGWNGSSDPAKIKTWFGPGGKYEGSGIAIDCDQAGIAVVDLDVKPYGDGRKQWEELQAGRDA